MSYARKYSRSLSDIVETSILLVKTGHLLNKNLKEQEKNLTNTAGGMDDDEEQSSKQQALQDDIKKVSYSKNNFTS